MKRDWLLWSTLALALASHAVADDSVVSRSTLDPLPAEHFDHQAAAHLLRCAGFGGTPNEVAQLASRGLDGAVDTLVEYERIAVQAQPFIPFHTDPRPQVRPTMSEEERIRTVQEHQRKDFTQLALLRSWWLERMVVTERPLEERLVLFWHGHFTSGHRDVRNSYHMLLQNLLLRRHASGNFGAFCKAIARDPAMLEYLDNRANRRQAPNENFARELMELFMLGIGNYTEQDIKEAARAFTGWTFDGNQFLIRGFWHDSGVKTVLGQRGAYGGDEVIDILLAHPATARHLAGKLFGYFVGREPDAVELETLATLLRGANYEIKPLLHKILRSQAFYAARGTRIKSPVELLVGTLRTFQLDPKLALVAVQQTAQLGQELLDPPNVKGWDGGRAWITTSLLLERYNAVQLYVSSPVELTVLERMLRSRLQRFRKAIADSLGMDPETMAGHEADVELPKFVAVDVEALIAEATSGEAIADTLCDRLLAVAPSAALRDELARLALPIALLPRGSTLRVQRLHGLLKLIVSTPEYQVQ